MQVPEVTSKFAHHVAVRSLPSAPSFARPTKAPVMGALGHWEPAAGASTTRTQFGPGGGQDAGAPVVALVKS